MSNSNKITASLCFNTDSDGILDEPKSAETTEDIDYEWLFVPYEVMAAHFCNSKEPTKPKKLRGKAAQVRKENK